MSNYNYYNKKLRDIGISNHTVEIGSWIGKTRRIAKAYCNSVECVGAANTKGKIVEDYPEDETCPSCGCALFFKKTRT